MEIIFITLVVGLVVLLLAAIGHVVWISLVAVLKGIFGRAQSPPAPDDTQSSVCGGCGTFSVGKRCPQCGEVKADTDIGTGVEWSVTRRQVHRLFHNGLIDQQTHAEMIRAIEQARLRQTVPRPAAQRDDAAAALGIPSAPPASDRTATAPASPQRPTAASAPAPAAALESVPTVVEPAPLSAQPPPTPPAFSTAMPPEPSVPRPPRRPFTAMLASFMEEKNIRWGELIGGMLIVFCSTALVISLWSQIAAIPTLRFFIFTAVTAAMFGAGLYTEHRWKLPTTSRGVLITASLLLPLNFLAIAAFSEGSQTGVATVIGEGLALGLFSALMFMAGRVLVPRRPALLAIAVVGASASQLLIRRYADPSVSTGALIALGGLPVGCFVTTMAWLLWGVIRRGGEAASELLVAGAAPSNVATPTAAGSLSRDAANVLFTFLGLAVLAVATATGLLLFKAGNAAHTLRQVAPLIALTGTPILATGLFIWQRVMDRESVHFRIAGTAVAVAGAGLMIAAMVPAWPQPTSLVPIASLNALLFLLIAVFTNIPAAHVPGGLCLLAAYLVSYHAAAGHVAWTDDQARPMIRALVGPKTGPALLPLVIAWLTGSAVLFRRRRSAHAQIIAILAALAAMASLVLVSLHGFGHESDHGATWIYAVYSVGVFGLAVATGQPSLTWLGAGLLLASLVQGCAFHYIDLWPSRDPRAPLQSALLAHATVMLIMAAAARWWRRHRDAAQFPSEEDLLPDPIDGMIRQLRAIALLGSLLAVGPMACALSVEHAVGQSIRTGWLALLWFVLAYGLRRAELFSAGQAATALALIFLVISRLARRSWFATTSDPLLDPRSLQAIGASLAGLSIVWGWIRLLIRQGNRRLAGSNRRMAAFVASIQTLLRPGRVSVDHITDGVVLAGFAVLVLLGIWVGCINELAAHTTTRASAIRHSWIPPIFDFGSWILAGTLLALAATRLWEAFQRRLVLSLVGLGLIAGALLAGRWHGTNAVASAWRWHLGAGWLIVSAVLWMRVPLFRAVQTLRWPGMADRTTELAGAVRTLLVLATVLPILLLTTIRAAIGLTGPDPIGPNAETLFARMGESLSYGLPLIAVSLGLIGHALRERSSVYTFCAGLVVDLTVTLAWLLAAAEAHRPLDGPALIQLLQFNAVAIGGFALTWFAGRYMLWRRSEPERLTQRPRLLAIQVAMGIALNAALILPAAMALVDQPGSAHPTVGAVGGFWGWLGLILCLASLGMWTRARIEPPTPATACVGLLTLSALISFDVARLNSGQWQAYHALLVGATVSAVLLLAYGPVLTWRRRHDESHTETLLAAPVEPDGWLPSLLVAAGIALFLALRGTLTDPARPWWSSGSLVVLSGLAAALAPLRRQERYLYASGGLFNLAVTIWWMTRWWEPRNYSTIPANIELLEVNVIALLAPALGSVAMRLRGWLNARPGRSSLAMHEAAAVFATGAIGLAVAIGLGADAALQQVVEPFDTSTAIAWLACSAAAIISAACLFDRAAMPTWPLLYLLGLSAIGMALDPLNLRLSWLSWSAAVALPGYALAIGAAYATLRPRWAALTLGRPEPGVRAARWLVPAKIGEGILAVALSTWVALKFSAELIDRSAGTALVLRAAATLSLVVHGAGMAFLARATARGIARQAALLFAAAGLILSAWGVMTPGGTADTALNRAVVLLAVAVGVGWGYAFVLPRLLRTAEWKGAAGRALIWLAAAAGAALVFILVREFHHAARGEAVPLGTGAGLVVIATLTALAAVLISFAVGRDPLGLSERGRGGYVYAAEAAVALTFVHIRLTMPWLFRGFFEQYWPVIVMLISFAGVGLAEVFRRRGRTVLAGPLETTGIFLPLLPVLGFWTARFESGVDYSAQLLLVGLLYAALAIRRKSFGFGLLAALAGNGALWYVLHRTDALGFYEHPQLWLIPAGLSVLVAAHLNRTRLTPEQLSAIHYASMIAIYVASTADIFIAGVASEPLLPLVLAGLSVAGVLAGILLRIRSFLMLGTAFLLLALGTMIRYAAENFGWTWLWYVAGIITGVLILTLFALLEKKREKMLSLLDDLKQWQA